MPAGVPSIPAPKWAILDAAIVRDSASSSTCPPSSAACASSTLGPSAALTRSGSPRPHSIAKGMPQTLPDGVVSGVLKSPWASNQAIARRRSGSGAPEPGHRAGVGRAVAAEDEQSRLVGGSASPPSAAATRSRSRGRNSQIRCPVLRPRVVVGHEPGLDRPGRRRPGARRRRARGRARSARQQPELAQSGRRALHPRQVAAERRRHADDDDGPGHGRHGAPSWVDAHRRLRPRALFRALGVRGRAPPVRLGRPGVPDGRAARAGGRRDPGAVGRARSSATPNRPAIRCSDARSPRCTRPSTPTRS